MELKSHLGRAAGFAREGAVHVKIGVVKTAQTFGILGAKSGFSGFATSEL